MHRHTMTPPITPALRSLTRNPLATQEAIAGEPQPFPLTTTQLLHETWYSDWQRRLTRNLARRSDGRWEPLTRTHVLERDGPPAK